MSVPDQESQAETAVTDPDGRRAPLALLTIALVLGMGGLIADRWGRTNFTALVEEPATWRWAFAALALGPLVGIAAMLRLKRLPEAARIAGGLG